MKNSPKLVVICKGKSCSKNGAKKLLHNLKKHESNQFTIDTKHCFGKCGNGPIILILPDQKIYDHVTEEKIYALIKAV